MTVINIEHNQKTEQPMYKLGQTRSTNRNFTQKHKNQTNKRTTCTTDSNKK